MTEEYLCMCTRQDLYVSRGYGARMYRLCLEMWIYCVENNINNNVLKKFAFLLRFIHLY